VLYIAGRPNWGVQISAPRHGTAMMTSDAEPCPHRQTRAQVEWRGHAVRAQSLVSRLGAKDGEEAQRYDAVLIRLGTRDAKELSDGFPRAAEDLFSESEPSSLDYLEAGLLHAGADAPDPALCQRARGALLMARREECYQAGGYCHTPIGSMLPGTLTARPRRPMLDARFNLTARDGLSRDATAHGPRRR